MLEADELSTEISLLHGALSRSSFRVRSSLVFVPYEVLFEALALVATPEKTGGFRTVYQAKELRRLKTWILCVRLAPGRLCPATTIWRSAGWSTGTSSPFLACASTKFWTPCTREKFYKSQGRIISVPSSRWYYVILNLIRIITYMSEGGIGGESQGKWANVKEFLLRLWSDY